MLIVLLTLLLGVQSQTPPPLTTMLGQGLTWTDYLASTKQQREAWVRNAGRAVPDELVDRLKKAGAGLRLLVVAEDWCSDSVNSIPYLGTLATRAGVDLRVINSQVGKTIMETHRTPDGRAATPTVILVRDGKEAAAWVERPTVLQTWFVGMADKIDTSERQQRKLNWYDWSRGDDALREIVALAERAAKAPTERE